jgi:hypothetical protein
MQIRWQQVCLEEFMVKLLRFLIPAVILISSLVLTSQLSVAKPEYTKKEKKGCVSCHVVQGKKDLNDVGKCYEEKKSLETCDIKKK